MKMLVDHWEATNRLPAWLAHEQLPVERSRRAERSLKSYTLGCEWKKGKKTHEDTPC